MNPAARRYRSSRPTSKRANLCCHFRTFRNVSEDRRWVRGSAEAASGRPARGAPPDLAAILGHRSSLIPICVLKVETFMRSAAEAVLAADLNRHRRTVEIRIAASACRASRLSRLVLDQRALLISCIHGVLGKTHQDRSRGRLPGFQSVRRKKPDLLVGVQYLVNVTILVSYGYSAVPALPSVGHDAVHRRVQRRVCEIDSTLPGNIVIEIDAAMRLR